MDKKLFLAKASEAAASGRTEEAMALVARDARFWRTVLAEADALITKMIAVAALNRHYELGNLILRSMPPTVQAPAEWSLPFTKPELSMQRVITGEWIFSSGLLRHSPHDELESEDGAASTIAARLVAPLYQYQDTSNELAAHYANVALLLDAPLEEFPAVISRVVKETEETRTRLYSITLYNPAGRLALAAGLSSLDNYAVRVADLEGVRRAALLAARLRERGIKPSDVPAALSAGDLRSPYDQQPFEWAAEGGHIVFQGLEGSERGTHRIRY
jgi:hypothetical protein